MKHLTKVGIASASFAIAKFIIETPYKLMWFREMMKNALEATQQYLQDNPGIKIPTRIKVRALRLHDIFFGNEYTGYKFSVLNYKGMTFSELSKAIQMFCEGVGGKIQDDLKNFGVGMKITLARFTDVMIITHKADEVYSLVFGLDENGDLVIKQEVQECTDWAYDNAEYRGYDMEHEWTEVILLGRGPKQLTQNTLTHTFDAEKKTGSKHHALVNLFKRFVDIPSNIDIVFEAGESGDSTPHNGAGKANLVFKTKQMLWDNAKKQFPHTEAFIETVKDSNSGVTVHFKFDAPTPHTTKHNDGTTTESIRPFSSYSESRQATSSEFVGMIWGAPGEREMYGIIEGDRWKTLASMLGIFNDYQYFNIDIELPYNKYQPTTDRTQLIPRKFDWNEGQNPVEYKDFVEVIIKLLPQATEFLKKVKHHNELTERLDEDQEIYELLKEYHDNMSIKLPGKEDKDNDNMPDDVDFSEHKLNCPKCRKNGVMTPMPKGQVTCSVCGYTRKKHANSNENGNKKSNKSILDLPRPEFISETGGDKNMFARFTDGGAERDIIHINESHKSIERLYNIVLNTPYYQNIGTDVTNEIKRLALSVLRVNAGVTTMIAKARLLKDEWFTQTQFEAITSPEQYTFQAWQSDLLVQRLKAKANEIVAKHKKQQKLGLTDTLVNTEELTDSRNKIPETI